MVMVLNKIKINKKNPVAVVVVFMWTTRTTWDLSAVTFNVKQSL